MHAISSDIFLFLRSNQPIFQALCDRRQAVFDELLNAYTTSQQNVAALKKTFEAQASKMQELTGNLRFQTSFLLSFLPILTDCVSYLAAAADASELEAAKKKIAEVESRLGEKDGQLGQKDAQLDSPKTENAQLSKVESELQPKVQKLTGDHAAAGAAHVCLLQRLLDAREQTEGQLMKEKDLAMKRSEEIDAQYQDQIRAAQAKYDLSLASLHRADIALAGMPCFPCSLAAPN